MLSAVDIRQDSKDVLSVERKIGVAVVGLGVGEQHARAYLSSGQCDLLWLYDLDPGKARAMVDKLKAGGAAASFENILSDPDVEVVSIASFDDAHFEQVVAALEAGKHIFVEKPICRTVDELKVIKQAWSKHNGKLKLSSNLTLRAAPVYQWLKEKIAANDFGEIYAFDGDYLYGRLHKITKEWRSEVQDYSVMLGGGVHLIDLMLWLTGERPLSVHAMGNRICTMNTDFIYNDFVAALFRFPSSLIGRITANFGCIHRHQHVMRIFGTKGTFIYDDMGPRLHTSRDSSLEANPVSLAVLPKTKGDLIAPFISAISNEENLNGHTQTIFDTISVSAACDQALKYNAEVEVNYV